MPKGRSRPAKLSIVQRTESSRGTYLRMSDGAEVLMRTRGERTTFACLPCKSAHCKHATAAPDLVARPDNTLPNWLTATDPIEYEIARYAKTLEDSRE